MPIPTYYDAPTIEGSRPMRGADDQPGSMFSYVSLEERVPQAHPLRAIRRITDRALERLSPRFGTLYINFGRPSIPPERLLKASLLLALYSVRSERAFCEELDYNLLLRWSLDMQLMEPSFDPTGVHQEPRAAPEAPGWPATLR